MNDNIEERIDNQKKWARESCKKWAENKNRMLEPTQIEMLITIGIKNLEGQPLTPNQRKVKENIHKSFSNAFADIERMNALGFFGNVSCWDPAQYGRRVNRLPFPPEKVWKKDFPIDRVCRFITCLVDMFGDQYATKIARAIAEGLAQRQENSSLTLDVPIIKRSMGFRPGIVDRVF